MARTEPEGYLVTWEEGQAGGLRLRGWPSQLPRPQPLHPDHRWASLCTTLHCPHCSGWG